MLRLAIAFLVIALIAAFFGFAGVAALSWEGAKILFVVFLILAVLSFLGHGFRRTDISGNNERASIVRSSLTLHWNAQSQGGGVDRE